MSAPEHEVEREARRHRPALVGIFVSLAVVALLLLGYVVYVFSAGNPPEGAAKYNEVLPDAEMQK